jgi:hypothetical protein
MALYPSVPLATVSTGLFEQAMLQSAVKKRISIFQYLQKTFVPLAPVLVEGKANGRHDTGDHWCDTILCTKDDLTRIFLEHKGLGRK